MITKFFALLKKPPIMYFLVYDYFAPALVNGANRDT